MKRDMDLIRDLLLRIESDPTFDGVHWIPFDKSYEFAGHSFEEVTYHVDLLFEARLIKGNDRGDAPMIRGLTWEGHEFLDDIKDSGIWEKTKARVAVLPGVALSVIAEIAKAEIKKRLGL